METKQRMKEELEKSEKTLLYGTHNCNLTALSQANIEVRKFTKNPLDFGERYNPTKWDIAYNHRENAWNKKFSPQIANVVMVDGEESVKKWIKVHLMQLSSSEFIKLPNGPNDINNVINIVYNYTKNWQVAELLCFWQMMFGGLGEVKRYLAPSEMVIQLRHFNIEYRQKWKYAGKQKQKIDQDALESCIREILYINEVYSYKGFDFAEAWLNFGIERNRCKNILQTIFNIITNDYKLPLEPAILEEHSEIVVETYKWIIDTFVLPELDTKKNESVL